MKPTLSRKTLVLSAAALAVAAFAAMLLATRGSAAAPARPMAAALPAAALSVETLMPRQVTMQRTLAASGAVQARDELIVASDAAGARLLEVRVDIGARVRRGELLARGDDSALLAQAAQQDAQIRLARAELEQAQSNLDRAESVRDAGVYSTEALQSRHSAVQVAAARLELAQAQRQELNVRIAQTRVHAPADGVVSRRSATVGAVMQPGVELFRVLRDDELEWRAELPDAALQSIPPGASVSLHLDDQHRVEGKVRLIAPTVDARTRNGQVHVSLPRGTPLRAGSHVQGELRIGEAQTWALPETVVQVRDGQPFVYVIGDHGVAHATRVTTGLRQGGLVEVRGLAPGAQVVATGAGFVKDGERVRIANQLAADRGATPLPEPGRAGPAAGALPRSEGGRS